MRYLILLSLVLPIETALADSMELCSRELTQCYEDPASWNPSRLPCIEEGLLCRSNHAPRYALRLWRIESGSWLQAMPYERIGYPIYRPFFTRLGPTIYNATFGERSTYLLDSFQWGLPGDIPVASLATTRDMSSESLEASRRLPLRVFRQTSGYWYRCGFERHHITNDEPCSPESAIQFGLPGDVPLLGQFDDDGEDDLVVWRPSSGNWYIRRSSDEQITVIQWGLPGDYPLLGDINGDGVSDLTVFRPSTGTWYFRLPGDLRNQLFEYPSVFIRQWGLPEDHPFLADFDDDDVVDLTVWRPQSGNWYTCLSSASFECFSGSSTVRQFGLFGDYPMVADFDNDGLSELIVYRPSSGIWYSFSTTLGVGAKQFGLPTDIPVGLGVKDMVDALVLQ